MERLILRYAGAPHEAAEALREVHALDFIKVLDASPKMVLVEAPDGRAHEVSDALPGWKVSREQMVTLPSPPGPGKLG